MSEEAFAALNATFHDLGADLDAEILIDVICRKTATVNLEVEDGEPSAAWLTTAAQLVIERNATDCTVSAEVGADGNDRRRRLQIAGTDDLVARAPTYTFQISVSVPIVRLFGGSPLDMEAQLQAISAASTNLATTLARSWLVGGTLEADLAEEGVSASVVGIGQQAVETLLVFEATLTQRPDESFDDFVARSREMVAVLEAVSAASVREALAAAGVDLSEDPELEVDVPPRLEDEDKTYFPPSPPPPSASPSRHRRRPRRSRRRRPRRARRRRRCRRRRRGLAVATAVGLAVAAAAGLAAAAAVAARAAAARRPRGGHDVLGLPNRHRARHRRRGGADPDRLRELAVASRAGERHVEPRLRPRQRVRRGGARQGAAVVPVLRHGVVRRRLHRRRAGRREGPLAHVPDEMVDGAGGAVHAQV